VALAVEPEFREANAEALELADGSVDCVYSNGVLHHTASPQRAFDEVWRVLKPGGEAFITLYRKPSLKVAVAKAIRGAQAVLDVVLRQDRSLYRLVAGRRGSRRLGTMILEGVGVPVMEWYSRADITSSFSKFDIIEAVPVGCNIPRFRPRSRGWTRWGYMWLVHLRKPHDASARV
jgi:SAM-dependent methyltransferase